ncbi:ROK family protein [Flammeovirga sp. SJP92]|uniref:ROK family protein n=1 Tax=Flammeovirga sp. SJP92 TaxID=1775430 RepID=UPI00078995B8|nr:ROK family protein [Flammeovirga sp. SJP92]KXX71284.1 hypothetical protein AVL50_09520 [Flammeovirga sp. SJP92]
MIATQKEIVLTLDAGGTNFVFSAMQGGEFIVENYRLPAEGHDLEKSLKNILNGFHHINDQLQAKGLTANAISFAFPGPADYPNGIIRDLHNLTGYKGGVALGPMLNKAFGVPVYINNDGDLFALGEALGGFLPKINALLKESGSTKRYHNLVGYTMGTGLGCGIVSNGTLHIGDNSAGSEVFLLPSTVLEGENAEEGSCIRAVKRFYNDFSHSNDADELTPKDIFDIAEGHKKGNQIAAVNAFAKAGENLGGVLCAINAPIDAPIVIGGGLSGALKYILPSALEVMRSSYSNGIKKAIAKVYDFTNPEEQKAFIEEKGKKIKVPFSEEYVFMNEEQKIAIGVSQLGTSEAIALGAYAFAVGKLKAEEIQL